MAPPAVFPVSRRYVAVGKETTPGTKVVPTAYLPVNKFDPEDKVTFLVDDSWRNAMAAEYGLIQGPEIGDLDVGGPVYSDTIGHVLLNVLGDYLFTAGVSPAPNTHKFALLNSGTNGAQPPTHTFTDFTGVATTNQARVYAYTCLSEITFTGNAEQLLAWEGKATTLVGDYPAAALAAPSFSTVQAQAAWNSTVSIGGTSRLNVGEWAVTLTRQVDAYFTASGSQSPLVIARGPLAVSGKLTFAPAVDETPLTRMLANTQDALVIAATEKASGNVLTLQCSQAAYDTSKINASKSLFGFDVSFKGIANTTDVIAGGSGGYSPVLVTLTNTNATYN